MSVAGHYRLRAPVRQTAQASAVTKQGLSGPLQAGRDLRLDLLRGFCVFAMIVDHIGGQSWLYSVTGGNRFVVSAAEGFVFISGLVLGIVSAKRVRKEGLRRAMLAALRRARTLYLLTVILTLGFASYVLAVGLPWGWDLTAASPLELLFGTVTLRQAFYLVDVLLLYTLLLLMAPAVLILLAHRQVGLLLSGSWLLWAAYQAFPEHASIPWRPEGSGAFPFAAWQALFVTGLALGYHRDSLDVRLRRLPQGPLLAVFAALFAVLLLMDRGVGLALLGNRPDSIWHGDLFAKESLALGRLVAFVIVFAFGYLATSMLWRLLHASIGWFLLPIGQNALYAYTLHVVVVALLLSGQLERVGYDPEHIARNTLVQLGAVVLVWLAIRRRVLFGIIPR